jgi:hypothetical protein
MKAIIGNLVTGREGWNEGAIVRTLRLLGMFLALGALYGVTNFLASGALTDLITGVSVAGHPLDPVLIVGALTAVVAGLEKKILCAPPEGVSWVFEEHGTAPPPPPPPPCAPGPGV